MSDRHDDGRNRSTQNSENNGPGPGGGMWSGMGQGRGFSWMWIALLALLFLPTIMRLFTGGGFSSVTYNEFRRQVERDNVESVTIAGNRVEGVFSEPVSVGPNDGQQVQRFRVYVPPIGETDIVQLLQDNDVPIYTEPGQQQDTSILGVLLNILPFALLIYLFYRFYQGMQQRGQSMFNVGKNKAKLYDKKEGVETSLDDVAGLQSAKEEVGEIIDFLQSPKKYEELGARTPKGVLLVGPPGTGKTLLARAIAGEADVPFYSMSGSDFMEMFVGVGASRVRNLFKDAKKKQPSIVFIDELDSIGRHRGAGLGGGHDEREQTLNQLLSELDGFEPQESVIVLAATNRPDILDPALLRPGRFDRRITTNLPSVKDRVAILKIHGKERPLADDVDLEEVAKGTPGFSGADLANLLNEASLLSARRGKKKITMDHVNEARDKVMLGLERKNLTVSDEERRRVAYHESGHAITAALLPHADALLKVTIVPREHSMGVTQQIPEEEKHLYSEPYLRDRIAVMLGGRAAEGVVFENFTNGAENDITEATKIARKMVQSWGMSKRLGAFSAAGERKNVFLGEELSQRRDYSEETAREIDTEIMQTLEEAYDRARKTLEEHRDELDRLAERLLEDEEVSAEEVGTILGINEEKQEASD
ncbi:MAG: ATP-dependent zinc metalloprotease FtsH [Spirochaetota bacterium]